MTAPSTLHVQLPPADSQLKSFSDSPPTPYTPRSAASLSQNEDSASMSSAKPPRSPEAQSHHDLASPVGNGGPGSDKAEKSEGGPTPVFAERKGENGYGHSQGQEIELPEMGVAPPDTLPPSPPLTEEVDARDEDNAKQTSPGNLSEHPSDLQEQDITNWQSSVDGRDGSYHEDDLGYSTGNEVTPIDGPGFTPRTEGVSHARQVSTSSSAPPEASHPLRFDVHPPSPPLWEVIQPPPDNNAQPTHGSLSPNNHALRGERPQKAATTRPLIPFSSYYFGPPPLDAAYGTHPIGHIGVHHPREIIRIERDYTGGELVQFAPIYPLELEGRITPTQFLETINTINEILISAHSLRHSMIDNVLAYFTLQLSRFVTRTHYEKEMNRLKLCIEEINRSLYNPLGLNILWPYRVAFMFLEIEYYVSAVFFSCPKH
ncbi:Golgin subfamily A member 7/ERF4 family-domain-containing protein [Cristinia sonorae]|uniref:Ras modification protein ERF4 n=1 Tax=Cristinia sonorae TaxID=1940300 RepID=A0A8K0XQL8_9AGAR|nr:Golgin subfamily A member 7/ERF4 family-domain-containing protein [Cristinia sonorae]